MDTWINIRRCILKFFKYLSLVAGTFVAVAPIASCVVTAFKTDKEYRSTTVMVLPKNWLNFENFVVAWKQAKMAMAFKNSFIVLVFVLVGAVLLSSMTAYVLNRFSFPGNRLVKNLFLFAALIPGIATQVTVYKIMYTLGFIDKLYGYIILMIGSDIIYIYIFLQFFESISQSLDESAIIDGSSYFGVFFKILLPLSKPAIITCMILKE